MDNYYNICFNKNNDNGEIKFSNSLNELNEENVTELLNYYFPDFDNGDIKEFVQNIVRAKITLDELHYFAEKIKPHLYKILAIYGDGLTQAKILDYSIKIFAGDDSTERKTDIEVRMMLDKLINKSNNQDNYSSEPRYSQKDDIGSYTVSPLYSMINYITAEENKGENESVTIQFNDEEFNINGESSINYNDAR